MALEWQPRYPDWFPARSRRALALYIPQNLSPIVNPPPPVPLVWQSSYPSQVHRTTLPRADMPAYTSGSPFLGTALRSWPIYPSQILRVQVRQYSQSFEIGGVLNVPKVGSWRPRFPDQLLPARRTLTGISSWVVDPTTLLNAAICIEITNEQMVMPLLTAEVVLSPSLTAETLVLPRLTGEDLC